LIALLLWAGLAHAQPACESLSPLDRDALAVAWVSPAGRQVAQRTWLTVVPAASLRAWAGREQATPARLLQHLGLRRRDTPPRRPWKVTILEVDAASLCRPAADLDDGTPLAGLVVCPRGDRTVPGRYDGCGYTTDLAGDGRGADVFAIPWRDAASRGFCVLPLERFLKGE
jgi:hypothetical protein